jgi:hypothetical protein
MYAGLVTSQSGRATYFCEVCFDGIDAFGKSAFQSMLLDAWPLMNCSPLCYLELQKTGKLTQYKAKLIIQGLVNTIKYTAVEMTWPNIQNRMEVWNAHSFITGQK